MPKYRPTSYAKELAEVPISEVARIAGSLLRGVGAEAAQGAVRQAYELLEIACHARMALGAEHSYEAGLARYQGALESWEGLQRGMAKALRYDFEKDAKGRPLPVPLDRALAVLMPRPGAKAGQTKDERTARFRAFIRAQQWVDAPGQGEQESLIEAGEQIERWNETGIPAGDFGKMLAIFPTWWERHISTERSEAGRRGARSRSGKR